MSDVISVLEREPHLSKINQKIDPNEGINKSKQEDKTFTENKKSERM